MKVLKPKAGWNNRYTKCKCGAHLEVEEEDVIETRWRTVAAYGQQQRVFTVDCPECGVRFDFDDSSASQNKPSRLVSKIFSLFQF